MGGQADQQIISRLNADLYVYEEANGLYQDSFDLGWTFSDVGQTYFSQRLDPSDKSGIVFVAEEGAQVVGYLAGGLRHPAYRSCAVAEIENMYVNDHHRRSGVGRALVTEFRAWARAAGAERIRVACFAGNIAVDFYRAVGMTPFEIILEAPMSRT